MNAEAQAWSVAPFDPDGDGGAPAPSARRVASGTPGSPSSRRLLRSANRRSEEMQPEAEDASWNVLAEELLPFPLARRDLVEQRSEARGRTGEGRDSLKDAERARRYGEAWLERELIAIRYLADAGYPALDRRLIGRPLPTPIAQPATVRAATAHPAEAHPAASRGAGRPGIREAVQPRTGAAAEPRGLRRLLPGVATLAALAGLWVGAGMLATAQRPPLAVLPGSVKTPAGYVYVVRPGDTLWSIATRLQPSGDPRVLVAKLETQVRGGTLVPGSRLVLP